MKKSQEVRKKIQDLQELLITLDQERSATWGDDDQKKWDDLQAQIRSLEPEAQRHEETERLEELRTEREAKRRRAQDRDSSTPEEKAYRDFRLVRAIECFEKRTPLDGLELEMHQEGEKEAKISGVDASGNILIPTMMLRKMGGISTRAEEIANASRFNSPERDRQRRATMVAGTGSLGGSTIQTELGDLIPFLNPKLMVEALGATVFDGLIGNLDLPRKNARGSATFVGETVTAPQTNATINMVQFRPKRLTATSAYSKTLLRQSSLSIENFVRADLSEAIAIAWDFNALNGPGGADFPLGLLNISGVNTVVGGTNGAAFNWNHAVEFETKIAAASANVAAMAYLLTTQLVGRTKTVEKFANSGQAIWQTIPQAVGMLGTINEYRAERTVHLPTTLTKGTANGICHAAVFGDWSQLVLASWGPLDLTVDPYTQSKDAIVNVTVNSWVDANVLHPESFSIMKDALVA